ncbi:ATP-binding protein [Actinoallomurus purpureus]|uniref:ATP-binding protein n=1 Tax=Actinoallomurus purpureus TaxID=478114 RepID=UPI002091EF65|nr:ATP-binding protein [Actinoallomurus purpureus]MCO6005516.1 ATP-binding protein [Actinoallomurus purpureus]
MFKAVRLRHWSQVLLDVAQGRPRGRHQADSTVERPVRRAIPASLLPNGPTAAQVRRRWCRLDGDPEAVRTARGLVSNALRAWGRTDLLDDVTLVVSELVTNALVHALPPVTLTVTYENALVVQVADACRDLPARGRPGSGGRFGLWIAEELCDLSVLPSHDGKVIRAVFAAEPRPADERPGR